MSPRLERHLLLCLPNLLSPFITNSWVPETSVFGPSLSSLDQVLDTLPFFNFFFRLWCTLIALSVPYFVRRVDCTSPFLSPWNLLKKGLYFDPLKLTITVDPRIVNETFEFLFLETSSEWWLVVHEKEKEVVWDIGLVFRYLVCPLKGIEIILNEYVICKMSIYCE